MTCLGVRIRSSPRTSGHFRRSICHDARGDGSVTSDLRENLTFGRLPSMHALTQMNNPAKTCDECGSDYFPDASPMAALCPECAHYLYGYQNCAHAFAN